METKRLYQFKTRAAARRSLGSRSKSASSKKDGSTHGAPTALACWTSGCLVDDASRSTAAVNASSPISSSPKTTRRPPPAVTILRICSGAGTTCDATTYVCRENTPLPVFCQRIRCARGAPSHKDPRPQSTCVSLPLSELQQQSRGGRRSIHLYAGLSVHPAMHASCHLAVHVNEGADPIDKAWSHLLPQGAFGQRRC